MFENIIGQQSTISALRQAVLQQQLPQAILFHGPEFSSKLSTALELSRVLSCEQEGTWNCTCNACDRQRLLIHPNLLLLGYRDFSEEMAAAADVLLRTTQLSARYLFIRAVRKQLKGFDPVLWEGEAAKMKTAQQTVPAIEEQLNRLHPDSPLPLAKDLKKLLASILKLTANLVSGFKSENIPINQIRKAVFWAHHSSAAGKKVIIIENADKMQDSSRNSLLKILEEPPAELYLILLTTHRGAIIRTILSRLRPYLFRSRAEKESKVILQKIYKEPTGEFTSLKDYFSAWKELNPASLKGLVQKFIRILLDSEGSGVDILEEMAELFSTGSPKEALRSFYEELLTVFRQFLAAPGICDYAGNVGLVQIVSWTEILRHAIYNLENLNINPKNILETDFYKFIVVV